MAEGTHTPRGVRAKRMAFGAAIARRVKHHELTETEADLVMEDFADAMSRTERSAQNVRRHMRRGFNRVHVRKRTQ